MKLDESVSGAMSGAVLGGLLLGPFGAILGGQFGANIGADAKQARMAQDEMRRKGITPEVGGGRTSCVPFPQVFLPQQSPGKRPAACVSSPWLSLSLSR